MSNGYALGLLLQANEVYKGNYAGRKVTPPGMLRMLIENSRPNVLSQGYDDGSGHIKDVKIKYRTRLKAGSTATTDNCQIDARPAYSEASITASLFRKVSFFLENATVARYEKDASDQATVVNGIKTGLAGVTPFMKEQWDIVMEYANGLLADINTDLLAKQLTAFGVNQTTGLATAKTVNFPLDATNNDLTAGMSGLLADARANEINLENAVFVGNGLIDNYVLQQIAKSAAQNGLNTALQNMPKLYQDFGSVSSWGANQFGIFEKDAVQLIEINRYVGFQAGVMPGGSWYGNIPLPVYDSQGNLVMMNFDIQLKYIDCPEDVQIGTEYVTGVGRGWQVIISKAFDLFNQPNDMYAVGDRLRGVNGTLRYVATNL